MHGATIKIKLHKLNGQTTFSKVLAALQSNAEMIPQFQTANPCFLSNPPNLKSPQTPLP